MTSYIPTIAQCQTALTAAGFACGPIDGLGGPRTEASILSFQRARGIPQSGQLDAPTINALFPPKPKETSMLSLLPTIVQWIVALLPGIPDDINIVEAELRELASTDSGKQKLITALAFGKTLIAKIEAVLGAPTV